MISYKKDRIYSLIYASDATVNSNGDEKCVEGVYFPENEKEVLDIVKKANIQKNKLFTRGRGTSVSGTAQPLQRADVISLEKMNRILNIDIKSGLIEVEAGVTVAQANKELEKYRYQLSAFPASYRYSSIGGNIATNASGLGAVRYGTVANSVKSIAVVTGEGKLLKAGAYSIRDSLGHPLREIFIGTFGNFGIITSAVMSINAIPDEIYISTLKYGTLSEIMEKFEEISKKSTVYQVEIVNDTISEKVLGNKAYYVVIRANKCYGGGKEGIELRNSLSTILSSMSESKISADICVAKIHLPKIDKLFQKPQEGLFTGYYGHLADGLLHVNVCFARKNENRASRFIERVYKTVRTVNGSISGEHGIGRGKLQYLKTEDNEQVRYLRGLKSVFDPNNILNSGYIQ
ncbi:FAD-binding oxidoreductase [bacterium]|nr:FAD-binding oxidoreductase [bacterium]